MKKSSFYQNTGFGWWSTGDVAETLRVPGGGDSTKANLVVETPIEEIQNGTFDNGIGPGERRIHAGGCCCLNASHEQPILLSDRKGHNGITTDGTATTLTAQEKERPMISEKGGDAMESVVRRLTPLE